ncbi:LiaI-LiaF-like domain-containing protein [Duganella sp. P38]|uniref:LiaI-LiaF-like domain-containing protein n=1 Tax=Duganella sp. P38 TaxID=3423949 RepID=UPI003D791BD3
MRTRRRERNPATQMIIGLFVIGLGMLFLLDNLGWLDLDLRIHVVPTVLIAVGILKVMQTRTQSGTVVGGALILAGAVIMLKSLGFLYIDWRVLWPLFIIAAGVAVVVKSTINRKTLEQGSASLDKDVSDSTVNITAIMGGYKNRILSQDFRGGEITAIMGGSDLDLRQASINGEAVLNLFAFCGGITVKVPIDWTVVMEGTPIMGGFEEKTVPPAAGGVHKRLILRGYVIMGGVEVRN